MQGRSLQPLIRRYLLLQETFAASSNAVDYSLFKSLKNRFLLQKRNIVVEMCEYTNEFSQKRKLPYLHVYRLRE